MNTTWCRIYAGGLILLTAAVLVLLPVNRLSAPCLADIPLFAPDRANYADNADALNEEIRKEYTIHPDGSVDYHLYMRTRILTYRGRKQNGDMQVAYNSAWQKVQVDMSRTGTVRADGTRVPVKEDEINDIQDPDTARASIYSAARIRVINFPAVEPGAMVEADITVHTRRPGILSFWKREYFALSAPTAVKTVILHAPASVPVHWAANSRIIQVENSSAGNVNTWKWTGTMLPKMVDEPLSPPALHTSPMLFITTAGSFQDVAEFYNALVPWKQKGIAPDQVPSRLREISDTDELYIRFMSLFKPYPISFLDTDLKCQRPEITLQRGYGTPLQLAWLFRAILETRGINSDIFAVADSCMVSMLPLPFMPDIFSQYLLNCKGRWYSFSRRELTPGITGLDSHVAIDLADGSVNRVSDLTEDITITTVCTSYLTDGATEGILYSLDAGDSAAVARQGFRYLSGPELAVAKSMVLHAVDPMATGKVHFCLLDDLMKPVGIKVDFKIPEPVPSVFDSYFFPIPSSSILETYVQIAPDRKNPVWFPEKRRDVMVFALKLPLGAGIKSLPQGFCGQAGPFSWNVSVHRVGRTVYYTREIETERGLLPAGEPLEKFLRAFSELTGPGQGIVMFSP